MECKNGCKRMLARKFLFDGTHDCLKELKRVVYEQNCLLVSLKQKKIVLEQEKKAIEQSYAISLDSNLNLNAAIESLIVANKVYEEDYQVLDEDYRRLEEDYNQLVQLNQSLEGKIVVFEESKARLDFDQMTDQGPQESTNYRLECWNAKLAQCNQELQIGNQKLQITIKEQSNYYKEIINKGKKKEMQIIKIICGISAVLTLSFVYYDRIIVPAKEKTCQKCFENGVMWCIDFMKSKGFIK